MRIVAISDTHNLHKKLELPPGDFLVHCGDFTGRGAVKEVNNFLEWFSNHPHRYKILIAGNHDFLFEKDPYLSQALLGSKPIIYLQDNVVDLEGLRFYGSPWQPEFNNWAFNLPRGRKLAEKWAKIPDDTNVLITHCPPAGILDRTTDGLTVGCEELLKSVKKIRPQLHLFGHIHEAHGLVVSEDTIFANASICDERYNPINRPTVLQQTRDGWIEDYGT